MSMEKSHLLWVTKESKLRNIVPARYIFVFLACLGIVNIYTMRVNLSIAMVAMVNNSSKSNFSNSTSNYNLSEASVMNSSKKKGEFNWDEETQGLILGAFYWGYIFTQIPGGRLAEMIDGKWLFGGGILITAVLTLLTPMAARFGVGYVIANRVFQGLGQGVTYPAMHIIISKWAPINERSRFVSIIYSGCLLGTVIGFHVSSYLCEQGFAGGWPSVFYTFGAVSILWFILWVILVYNDPECHPWIKKEEKHYIQRGIVKTDKEKVKLPLPWKEMIKSLPLWAIIAAHISSCWGVYTFVSELPTYLKTVLHFDMTSNGLLSAVPYLICWLCSLLVSYLCDKLIEKSYLQLTTARKIFNSLGLLAPAIFLVSITFFEDNSAASYAMIGLAIGINGCVFVGFQVNHIDIASNFAGTLMGITNSLATLPGMISPLIVGALTEQNSSRDQWDKLFYITAAFYIFGGVFFIIFGSAEEQHWNKCSPEKNSPCNINKTTDLNK